jgi:protein-S-isoprenylcysteine O-methyltransferase Ste14
MRKPEKGCAQQQEQIIYQTGSKSNVDSAHKSGWEIAEVVFGVPFLVGVGLHFVVPLSLPQGALRLLLIPIGVVLIVAGISLIILARREFARYAQPTDPGHPTSKIIKTGVFAISRNPLYLGVAAVFLGIALTLNMLWTLVTLLASMVLCFFVLIVPEEHYLAAKFGQEYAEYIAAVHRWLGRR